MTTMTMLSKMTVVIIIIVITERSFKLYYFLKCTDTYHWVCIEASGLLHPPSNVAMEKLPVAQRKLRVQLAISTDCCQNFSN